MQFEMLLGDLSCSVNQKAGGGGEQWGDGDIYDCRTQSCPAFIRVSALHLHCSLQNEACVTL